MKPGILFKVSIAAVMVLLISSCLKNEDDDRKIYTAAEEIAERNAYLDSLRAKGHDIDTTASGVYYVVIEEGEGNFAQEGDTVTIGYAGYLIDGTLFDTSERPSSPFQDGKWEFILGDFDAIKGWDESIMEMNEGAKMEFIVPSELAYGSSGYGLIPPYQTLIFVIKMFEINPSEN